MKNRELIETAKKALELAEAATPGPWIVAQDEQRGYVDARSRTVCTSSAQRGLVPDDLNWIAFSRTSLPVLAQHVLDLEAKLERVKTISSEHLVSMLVVAKERDQALARVAELEESAKLSNAVKLGEMLEASRARVAKLEETLRDLATEAANTGPGLDSNWVKWRASQALKGGGT